MSRKRKLVTHALAFAAGIAVVVLFGAYLEFAEPERSEAMSVMQRWKTFVDKSGYLTIPLPGRGMIVRIRCRGPSVPGEADFEILAEKIGAVFEYEWQGKWGAPFATYAGGMVGEGHDWMDYDADGMFDFHLDQGQRKLRIRTGERWLVAERITNDKAVTAEGEFAFDPKRGQWERTGGE